MKSVKARELYDAMRALEGRAKAARRKNGLPYSRREVAREAGGRNSPLDRRIGEWLHDDFNEAKTPRLGSSDQVMAVIKVWSEWAGENPRSRDWLTLIDEAQPRPTRPARAAEPQEATSVQQPDRDVLLEDCRDFERKCNALQDDFGKQYVAITGDNSIDYSVDLSQTTATGQSWPAVKRALKEIERSARMLGHVDPVLRDTARSVYQSVRAEVEAMERAGTDLERREGHLAAWSKAREQSDELRDKFTDLVHARR